MACNLIGHFCALSCPAQLTVLACGAVGIIAACRFSTFSRNRRDSTFKDDAEGEYKMVILVRTDLNMTKGKAAAQCCHAVLEAYKAASAKYPQVVRGWEQNGQPKVTLKVESQEQLMELIKAARQAGVCAESIIDAGRTQLTPGTRTVAALGPAPKRLIDLITGHLKLY